MRSIHRRACRWIAVGAAALALVGAARAASAGGSKHGEYVKMPRVVRQGLLKLFRVPAGTTVDNARQLKHRWQRGICGVVFGDLQPTQDFYLPGGPSGKPRPDSAPRRLRDTWLTDQGTSVADAHAYLHPGGSRATAGRWVMAQEGLLSWLGRRWDIYQPHVCSGSEGH